MPVLPVSPVFVFGLARSTATTFDIFFRLQVTVNLDDVSFLQSAPNRPDYMDIWVLWLHGHRFVVAFPLA